jgi:hypothetical protein
VAALVCSVLGIGGGALALAKPKLAGWLMLIAVIGGTIGIFVAYFVAGPLLLIGSVLASLFSKHPLNGVGRISPPSRSFLTFS